MSCARISLVVALIAACGTPQTEARPRETTGGGVAASRSISAAPSPHPLPGAAAPAAPVDVEAIAPAAPVDVEPAYDLAHDLERRTKLARQELGARVRVAVVSDVFLVVGAQMSASMFKRAVSLTRRATAAYFNGRFAAPPPRAVSVYVFGGRSSYQRFCKKHYDGCGTPYGVYYYRDRRIVMNGRPGLGTLTHELVHPIIETDFPNAPAWINEGIASLFERPSLPRAGEIHGLKNWRYPRLARALRTRGGRAKANLHQLFSMSDAVFRGADEDLGYAMARYLCQWLDEKKLLWSFYQRWRDGYADDPSGTKAFAAVVGKDPRAANADWVRWLKRL